MSCVSKEWLNLIEKAKTIEFGTRKERLHLMPTIFNKNRNENFISDWLAFILNPSVNSLGIVPLNLLLKVAGEETEFSDEATTNMGIAGEYSPCRECYLDDNKENRIDLLFKVEDFNQRYLIAIENKVYSGQSKENQLLTYQKFIEQIRLDGSAGYSDYKGCKPIMIYLTLTKSDADIEGTEFKSALHTDFTSELKKIPLDFVGHLRESFIISEYIKNMEEYIMPNNDAEFKNDEIEFFMKNCDLLNQISVRKDNFIPYLRRRVYEEASKLFDSSYDQSSEDISGRANYHYWYKKGMPYRFHIEIKFTEDNTVKVMIHNEKSVQKQSLIKCLGISKSNTIEEGKTLCINSYDSIEEITDDLMAELKIMKEKYDEYVANYERKIGSDIS